MKLERGDLHHSMKKYFRSQMSSGSLVFFTWCWLEACANPSSEKVLDFFPRSSPSSLVRYFNIQRSHAHLYSIVSRGLKLHAFGPSSFLIDGSLQQGSAIVPCRRRPITRISYSMWRLLRIYPSRKHQKVRRSRTESHGPQRRTK